jgi:hypothetical protein
MVKVISDGEQMWVEVERALMQHCPTGTARQGKCGHTVPVLSRGCQGDHKGQDWLDVGGVAVNILYCNKLPFMVTYCYELQ